MTEAADFKRAKPTREQLEQLQAEFREALNAAPDMDPYDGRRLLMLRGSKLLHALDSPPDHGGGKGWQNIEMAPKDSTPILVGRGRVNLGDGTYKGGIVLEAQWDANELGWYFGGYVGGWLQVDPEHPPTHWQPLPAPPRAAPKAEPESTPVNP